MNGRESSRLVGFPFNKGVLGQRSGWGRNSVGRFAEVLCVFEEGKFYLGV